VLPLLAIVRRNDLYIQCVQLDARVWSPVSGTAQEPRDLHPGPCGQLRKPGGQCLTTGDHVESALDFAHLARLGTARAVRQNKTGDGYTGGCGTQLCDLVQLAGKDQLVLR